jgi:hypothetical protein
MKCRCTAKVTVWCAVGALGIVGPYFFENENEETVTVNSERYLTMLEGSVEPQLQRLGIDPQTFIFSRMEQQPALHEKVWLFVKCSQLLSLISATAWPARSPDLTVPDFFLWKLLKDLCSGGVS